MTLATLYGRFDETCPYCEIKLNSLDSGCILYEHFQSGDYETEFTLECPHCKETIEVVVHSVPEFELFKQEKK